MLLTEARRGARTAPDGSLITLDQQDRSKWNHRFIAEGVELISSVLPSGDVGPYQVQAAIAAVHDEAKTMDATDWPQILALYDLLEQLAPSPMVSLNRAVAVAMVAGPPAGLDLLATLESDRRLAAHHRLHAAKAHLLEMANDSPGAVASYRKAARLTTSIPERRYLLTRAARLAGNSPPQVPENLARRRCREPPRHSDPEPDGRKAATAGEKEVRR